jgi:O-antigen ligase
MAQTVIPDTPPAARGHSSGRAVAALDTLTEAILAAMILFAPWAFGTTQPWSVRWMNGGGYALGLLFLAKTIVRRGSSSRLKSSQSTGRLTAALFMLTLAILGYILAAALNAEFTYIAKEFRADSHPYVKWLPHSLDRLASWRVFWNWLALAGVFWAACDWLVTDIAPDGHHSSRRLRRLIFVLAANGALVAFEGILQRTSGTAKLLWFQPTHDNPSASAQFGPYAYRANAAQFFNLLWPVALGLWWHLQCRGAETARRTQRHHWLVPCVMLLIAAPLISMSRGGVAVALVQIAACGCLLFAGTRFNWPARVGIVLVFAITVAAAWYLGGEQLAGRLRDTAANPLSGREETYALAARMAQDYPWFGVGPGAFKSVFQLYRNSPSDYWPAQLHNDWMEYLITFGRIGCALLLAAGALIAARWFAPGGLRLHRSFVVFVWIALAGCLLHARFDFPLQIYSIQFVFVLLCAVLFSVTRRA